MAEQVASFGWVYCKIRLNLDEGKQMNEQQTKEIIKAMTQSIADYLEEVQFYIDNLEVVCREDKRSMEVLTRIKEANGVLGCVLSTL